MTDQDIIANEYDPKFKKNGFKVYSKINYLAHEGILAPRILQ